MSGPVLADVSIVPIEAFALRERIRRLHCQIVYLSRIRLKSAAATPRRGSADRRGSPGKIALVGSHLLLAPGSDFYVAMYGKNCPVPDGTMDGCYVNYPDSDLTNWAYLYYLGNYPALQGVKARWDPNNVFNHDQSVR